MHETQHPRAARCAVREGRRYAVRAYYAVHAAWSSEDVPHPAGAEARLQPTGIEANIESCGIGPHAEVGQLLCGGKANAVGKREATHAGLHNRRIRASV